MSAPNARAPIGETLIAEGALTREQLTDALSQQQQTGLRLGELLVGTGLVGPSVVVRALAESLGLDAYTLCDWGIREGVLLDAIAD